MTYEIKALGKFFFSIFHLMVCLCNGSWVVIYKNAKHRYHVTNLNLFRRTKVARASS